jgi:hypothetical protein
MCPADPVSLKALMSIGRELLHVIKNCNVPRAAASDFIIGSIHSSAIAYQSVEVQYFLPLRYSLETRSLGQRYEYEKFEIESKQRRDFQLNPAHAVTHGELTTGTFL